MKSAKQILIRGMLAVAVMAAASAQAQIQTTGTPGSPSATTTIDGRQLPPPDPKFGGVIKDTATDSKPWWPPTVVPPKGAPNILLIMTDDQGYGVYSTFGGVIPTPAMDRIAKAGLRYTQFHSTALCSPTRALPAFTSKTSLTTISNSLASFRVMSTTVVSAEDPIASKPQISKATKRHKKAQIVNEGPLCLLCFFVAISVRINGGEDV